MAEITKSGVANLGSQEDLKNVKHALEADGSIKVVDDPDPETVEDDEGNEVVVQPGAIVGAVAIKVDADEKAAKEAEKEAEKDAKEAAKAEKASAKNG